MIHEKNATFSFRSKAGSADEIQSELNDMKVILLAIALKLEGDARSQLIKELNTIQSDTIKQWTQNLSSIGGN
ncbi:hypothetical protein [Pantoea dispersa]|uniref:hypothetical protein n=1 Tax=Pantoea dispersa TaxID=59814 RepID=UPI0024AF1F18|nr:hypothetical protein [Pantoea dispersa]MDI6634379.1 hypothetical protein [Pantoea dispersa]